MPVFQRLSVRDRKMWTEAVEIVDEFQFFIVYIPWQPDTCIYRETSTTV
jgi:hypothetical protein